MTEKNKKVTISELASGATMFLAYIYIFFWENRIVNTAFVFASIGIFSLLYLVIKRQVRVNSAGICFAVIMLLNLIGLFYSKGNFAGKIDWINRLIIVFVFYIALTNTSLKIERLVKSFLLLSVVFTIGVISEYLKLGYVDIVNRFLLKDGCVESNHMFRSWGFYAGFSAYNIVSAVFSMMALFIALSTFYCSRKKSVKIMCLVLCAISLAAIIFAQKRGIFVASLAAVVFALWSERMNKQSVPKKIIFFVTVIIMAVLIGWLLLNNTSGQQFLGRFIDTDDISSGRFTIAQQLLSNWGSYLVFGNGPASALAAYSANVHNIYLQIFYENGILGLSLYLLFFVRNLSFAIKGFKRSKMECDTQYIKFMLISILTQIGFLVYGLFGNPLNDLYIYLIYLIFSALPYSDIVLQAHLLS